MPVTETSSLNATLETCIQRYEDYVLPTTEVYCNFTWDTFLCWPPTKAGTTAKQKCSLIRYNAGGIDPTKFALKRCSIDGKWEGKGGTLGEPQGWTNYTPCFIPEVQEIMKSLYGTSDDKAAAELKLDIASRTRTLEFVGLGVSLAALLLSLGIFCHFRSLRNNRTRIHKNLFVAMVIQVLIRLTLYIDQAVLRGKKGQNDEGIHGIDNTPFLCEGSYVLLEYARTAMFIWMFIEGLYLHNVVTVTVFQQRFPHYVYGGLGWGVPVIMTTAWALVTAFKFGASKCWFGYNLSPYYWILEGPRLGVIVLNFLFLLNIIRVLVVKLRQSHTSDVDQVRKAVRAAVVLLPLLGITNLLNMTQAPLHRSPWEFAIWSYTTHFLTSFQGFLIALLYCFLNGEVRIAIMKSVSIYLSLRGSQWAPKRSPRPSVFSGGYATAPENDPACIPKDDSEAVEKGKWVRLCCKSGARPVPPEPTAPE